MASSVVVPQSQIDQVEQARLALWELYKELYPDGNISKKQTSQKYYSNPSHSSFNFNQFANIYIQ